MKKIFILIALDGGASMLTVQSIGRNVLSSAGESISVGGSQLDYALGELITLTAADKSTDHISQGFIQPAGDKYVSTMEISKTDLAVSVFPNPVSSMLNIQLTENLSTNLEYTVFDIRGRKVMTGNLTEMTSQLAVDHLSSANYVLTLSSKSIGFYKTIRFSKM